jgi:hypothetical protein
MKRTCRATGAITGTALLLLFGGRAGAVVERDNDGNHSEFNVARLAFSATIGPGDDRYLLVGIVTADGAPPVASASLGSVRLDQLGGGGSPMGHCRVEWWGLLAPAVGTQPLTVELAAPTHDLGAAYLSYRGVSPLHPVGPVATSAGSGASAVTVTGAASGDLVLESTCGFSADSTLDRAGPQQTALWHWSAGSLSTAGSEHPGGESAVTMTWTAGGSGNMEWAATGLSLRAADGAAGGLPHPIVLDESAGCALGQRRSGPPLAASSGMVGLCLWAIRIRRRSARARSANTRREPNPVVRVEPLG